MLEWFVQELCSTTAEEVAAMGVFDGDVLM
jgi:hypothetical protein